MRVALAPPNPNELLKTKSNFAVVGSFTSLNRQPGSGWRKVVVGGNHCSRKAIKQTTASTAPAAPSRWPILAFVELIESLGAASPAQRLIAWASALSFRGVPVPCALM